ncbi:Uu.00g068990.m01.CDS01 [Anthostomella pinea]|uniref:Uu.00g068990.m01.CDS01 n=1 Tax=Anthostomella pinea TaxID=933095 RepID=A0AAI8VUG2_9PEZI|nr:Uu.00g068990.m01.CDS01 [Anthostomella pinea]
MASSEAVRASDEGWMNMILPENPHSLGICRVYKGDDKHLGRLGFSQQGIGVSVPQRRLVYGRLMLGEGEIRGQDLEGDAGSAPGFMKSTGHDASGGELCDCVPGDRRQVCAGCLVEYVQF